MDKARLVALDIGNGFVKYLSSSAEGFFPSVYCLQEPGISFDGLASSDDFVIEFEGGDTFAIGWSAPRLGNISVRTLDRSRILGPEYKVLFAAALAASAGKGGNIAPILSLPLAWYDRRNEVKQHLAGEWTIKHGGRWHNFIVLAENMRIIPEGFGTVCSLALDRNGKPYNNGLLTQRVGVIDIGTKTTDLSMFDGLQFVPARTAGHDVGLERVYNIMERLANRELGHSFTIEQLDTVLCGESLYHGPHDVTNQANEWKHQALKQVSDAIAGHVNTLWQGGQDVRRLLITGGGAAHVYPYLCERYEHMEPVENGPMANVIGAYSYGLLKAGS